MTGADDALLDKLGDEALGVVSATPYTVDLDTDGNQRFVEGMLKNHDVIPGFYAAALYINCQVVDAGLRTLSGDLGDKDKFMATLKAVSLADTPRGPLKFDHLNNAVGNIYVRRLGKDGAKYGLTLWNKTIKTYENVSQFWDLAGKRVPRPPGLYPRLSAVDEMLKAPARYAAFAQSCAEARRAPSASDCSLSQTILVST